MQKQVKRKQKNLKIKEVSTEEFKELTSKHIEEIFSQDQRFDFRKVLTEEEIKKSEKFKRKMGEQARINLVIYEDEKFAGWSYGFAQNPYAFYMCNSAILPEFRGQYKRGQVPYTKIMQVCVKK